MNKTWTSKIFLVGFLLLTTACSHTISFRASHFAVPVTAPQLLDGHVALVASSDTKITLFDDITSNPPSRRSIHVNETGNVADAFALNLFGLDASLGLTSGLEAYLDNSLWGLRWQFLNHNQSSQAWVASIQAAYGNRSETTTDDVVVGSTYSSSVKSDITTQQVGASVGYAFTGWVVYGSFIHEEHLVKSTVTNSTQTYDYKDTGLHNYYSLGISTDYTTHLRAAVEYSYVDINWGPHTGQNAAAAKLGYSW